MKHTFLSMFIGLFVIGTTTLKAQSESGDYNQLLAYMQRAMRFNKAAPQEKVYLHFDNTGYFKGETIRFKAYVKRMDSDRPSNISSVLYVELVNPIGDVCERRTLKVVDGIADGDIKLDSIVGASGFYEVRAFTRYMSNWGTSAAFSRVFPIFNKPKVEGNYSNAVIDKVSFRHRLPNTRVDEDGKVAESTTDLEMNSVKFYPEGGDLVKGLTSRVAFTVTNKEGKRVAVKGSLLNAQKQKLGAVETDETGRGVFEVCPMLMPEPLYVQLPDEKGKMREYKLPEAKEEGCVLTLDMMDDTEITATIHSTSGIQGRLLGYVLMHNGTILDCDTMTAQPFIVKRFEKLSLPAGVSQFTLFNSEGRILAERLFFLMPFASESDSIFVTTNLRSLSPCCKVELDLQAAPNSSISFSAMDAATMTNGKEGNMKTWMLLSSEVSGYIDSPDYYFEADDVAHRRAADLLMMTQGWRRYDWQLMSGQKVLDKVEPNEDGLYIFGQLTSKSKKRDVGNVDLSMTLFNRDGQSMSGKAKTDSLGRYSFKLPDCSGDWALQIKSEKEGEAQNYVIAIDRHFSPAMRLLSPYETEMLPVGECNFFKNNQEEKEEEFVSITKKVHVLPTVKVKTRRILGDLHVSWYDEDWAQSKASVYYDCDTYADEIADRGEELPTFDTWLKSKNSLIDGVADPLPSHQIFVQPTEIGVADANAGKVLNLAKEADEHGSSPEHYKETLLSKSGEKPVFGYDNGLMYDRRPIVWIVNNMFCCISGYKGTRLTFTKTNNDTGILERPEFLNEAKSVYFTENLTVLNDYIQSTDLMGANPVIAFVYTHPLFYFKTKGLRKSHFYGYNMPTKFEMEDYSILPPTEDFRRTLFWDANVKTDQDGKAKVEFYNNSSAKEFFISAEGMTADGKLLISE
ncbi:MAG: hypothetical protein K6E52_04600 [Bacteroidaceae bacterium]|nr:hypothetical protein [Bacteroidaceae bacterium]